MPSRQPRWPSMGLDSWSSATRPRTCASVRPVARASSAMPGLVVRQELVQRRVDGPDGDRPRRHGREEARRSRPAAAAAAWPAPRAGPRWSRPRSSRASAPIFPSPKNMCSVRHRPMPSRAEGDGGGGLVGLVGVGPHARAAGRRRPSRAAWRSPGRPARPWRRGSSRPAPARPRTGWWRAAPPAPRRRCRRWRSSPPRSRTFGRGRLHRHGAGLVVEARAPRSRRWTPCPSAGPPARRGWSCRRRR